MSEAPPLTRLLLAGITGTVALQAFAVLRNRVLGEPPPYAVRNIVTRLARRVLRRELPPPRALRWGAALRAMYGPMLGVAWATVSHLAPTGPVPRGLLLGLGVLAFEHVSFPLVGATTPQRTWTRAEHAWLIAQTAVFGVANEATLALLSR